MAAYLPIPFFLKKISEPCENSAHKKSCSSASRSFQFVQQKMKLETFINSGQKFAALPPHQATTKVSSAADNSAERSAHCRQWRILSILLTFRAGLAALTERHVISTGWACRVRLRVPLRFDMKPSIIIRSDIVARLSRVSGNQHPFVRFTVTQISCWQCTAD